MVRYGSFVGKSLLSGVAVVGIAAVGMVAGPRAALANAASGEEAWNSFIPVPTGSWNDLEVTFAGNQTGIISSQTYAGTNPFLSGTLATTYDSNTNVTTVEYAGSMGTYGNQNTWANYDSSNNTAHFGLINNLSSPTWLAPTSITWTNSTNSTTLALPAPPQVVPGWVVPTAGTSTQNLVLFLGSTDPGTKIGQWYEVPFSTGTPLPLTLSNYGTGTDTFGNYGYFISPSYIPLDMLNFGSEPPPGQPGSPFTTLPNPAQLGPGQSETISGTPEPSALGLLALGGLVLLIQRRVRAVN